MPNIQTVLSADVQVSPDQIRSIRHTLLRVVASHTASVDEVLSGQKKWSASQVQLYKLLLGKVLPDISASYVETTDTTTRKISGLSREELETLAADRDHEEPEETLVSADLSPGDTSPVRDADAHPRVTRTPRGHPA